MVGRSVNDRGVGIWIHTTHSSAKAESITSFFGPGFQTARWTVHDPQSHGKLSLMRPLVWSALAIVLVSSISCRGPASETTASQGQPKLRAVLVSDRTPQEHRPLDLSTRADRLIRGALLSPERFASTGVEDHSACAAEIDLMYAWVVNGQVAAAAAVGVARIAVDAQVHCLVPGGAPEDVETFRTELVDEESYGGPGQRSGKETLELLLEGIADSVGAHLYGQVRMRHASDDEVRAGLKADAPAGLLMEAAAEAGERKLTDVLEDVIALTQHPDDTVVLRAAASIGRLSTGDEASARALAKLTSGSDTERHLVAIQALGDVGGAQALRYLDTLTEGHPEAGIRNAARQAAARARAGELPD